MAERTLEVTEPEIGENTGGGSWTPEDFERLVRERYRLVFAICFKVLGSRPDAEDAAQEAFLKAHRSRGSLRDPEQATGWLARIARNAALDLGRRRSRQKRLKETLTQRAEVEAGRAARGVGWASRGEGAPLEPDERSALLRKVAALPEKEALVVTLRFLEGLEPTEIAARLGEKPGTVRVRLHRALQKLRAGLGGASGRRDGAPERST